MRCHKEAQEPSRRRFSECAVDALTEHNGYGIAEPQKERLVLEVLLFAQEGLRLCQPGQPALKSAAVEAPMRNAAVLGQATSLQTGVAKSRPSAADAGQGDGETSAENKDVGSRDIPEAHGLILTSVGRARARPSETCVDVDRFPSPAASSATCVDVDPFPSPAASSASRRALTSCCCRRKRSGAILVRCPEM